WPRAWTRITPRHHFRRFDHRNCRMDRRR
ncbi:MAG: hypothetical protein AVDCRST_MAG71-2232, partial [uncultured Lysobacter sp.]